MSDPFTKVDLLIEDSLPTLELGRLPKGMNATSTIMPDETHVQIRSLMHLPVIRSGDGTQDDISEYSTLGTGGMDVVLLARQHALLRDVAVKTARKTTSESANQAILNEALITGHLEHPGIIPIHMVGRRETGEPLIVMKKVEGVTWADVIHDPNAAPKKGKASATIDLDWHLEVFTQVCNAVSFAHHRGVIHRDVKPENVMIGRYGEVYLLDWGIATGIPNRMPPFIRSRDEETQLVGTPAYMAPEMVAENARRVDERTDVFLLGATLYHVVTKTAPYAGIPPHEALLKAHACPDLAFPHDVPEAVKDIIQRCMNRDPAKRYESVDALLSDTQMFRQNRGAQALIDAARRALAPNSSVLGRTNQLELARSLLVQSLAQWPQNETSRNLLSDVAKELFHQYVAQDNLGSAKGVLPDVRAEDHDALKAKFDDLEGQKRTRESKVQQILHANNPVVDVRRRIALGVGISVVWIGLALFKGIQRWGVPADEIHVDHLLSILPTVGVPLVLILGVRPLFQSNDFNQRIAKFFVAGLCTVAALRAVFWRFDIAAQPATAIEFIFYSLVTIAFGLFAERRVLGASWLVVAAACLAAIWPAYQFFYMAGAYALFATYVGWVWARAQN
ncbi:MAG: serine/threonine-protein kinase [bacterium]